MRFWIKKEDLEDFFFVIFLETKVGVRTEDGWRYGSSLLDMELRILDWIVQMRNLDEKKDSVVLGDLNLF